MNVKQLTKKPKVVVEQSGMSDNVQIFKRKEFPPEEIKKLRVAAYCRVSTDREEQESSLQIQMGTYKDLIDQHPDWELVDIYADPGISGTSVRHRKEFLRMIEDAKAGKIDLILAKSISRFARNTEDMENIYKAAEIRRNAVLNLEIIMPDADEKIQIPIVNRGAGHGNHKNRKQKRM